MKNFFAVSLFVMMVVLTCGCSENIVSSSDKILSEPLPVSETETLSAESTVQTTTVSQTTESTATSHTTSSSTTVSSASDSVSSSTETTTTEEIQPSELPPVTVSIADDAGIFSDSDTDEILKYEQELYNTYMIEVKALTTDDLKELSPEKYVKTFCPETESEENVLIVVINNDTHCDYIFKKGICAEFIAGEDEEDTFYYATKDIVSGDFKSAVIRFLQLCELCPSHVFDYAGIYGKEELVNIESTLSGASGNTALFIIGNSREVKTADELYQRRFGSTDGMAIVIDTVSDNIEICSENEIPETMKWANEKAQALVKEKKYKEAANVIIESIKG